MGVSIHNCNSIPTCTSRMRSVTDTTLGGEISVYVSSIEGDIHSKYAEVIAKL